MALWSTTNHTVKVSKNPHLSTHPGANKKNDFLNGADVGRPCSFLATVETNLESPGAVGSYQKNLGKLTTSEPTFGATYL